MTPNKGIFQVGLFYVDHLDVDSERDSENILRFHIDVPEGQGLEEYLKSCAGYVESDRTMRTYLVRDVETDECIGYFSLKAGLISLNEVEVEKVNDETGEKIFVLRHMMRQIFPDVFSYGNIDVLTGDFCIKCLRHSLHAGNSGYALVIQL